MVRTKATKRPQASRARSVTTPAPYLGLNTVDSLADMDPRYGLSIQNFIATPQGLTTREGYRRWATGLPGDVTALMPYHAANGTSSKLFAASVSGFYDVTAGGVVGAAVVGGLNASKPWWQHALQAGQGKNFLIAVNGIDAPRLYDGAAWTTCTQVASPSTLGQFSTVDNNGNAVSIAGFVDVMLHQRRMWFTPINSTKAYYTNIDTPSGALFAFDFGSQFPRGGALWKLASWSVNMGSVAGVQQILVAISSKGDVAVYAGNDPSSASSWSLSAVYQLGAPAGRRCTQDFESDLLYLSRDGLYPMSKYIQSSTLNNTDAITTKIANTIGDLIDSYGDTPGFEMCVYPGKNIMLLNVPQSSTASNFQFCFNTVTNGWTQFTGWGAASWGLFNNSLFFGGVGTVNLAFIGYSDNADIAGVGGNNIIATALTAFTYFNDVPSLGRGVIKHVKQVKPFVVTGVSNPTIRVGVNTDFSLIPIIGSATLNPITGAVWDNATWDNAAATWVGSLTTYNQWASPLCYPGDAIAFAMSISATAVTLWASTGWIVEQGGIWG